MALASEVRMVVAAWVGMGLASEGRIAVTSEVMVAVAVWAVTFEVRMTMAAWMRMAVTSLITVASWVRMAETSEMTVVAWVRMAVTYEMGMTVAALAAAGKVRKVKMAVTGDGDAAGCGAEGGGYHVLEEV